MKLGGMAAEKQECVPLTAHNMYAGSLYRELNK